MVIRYSISFVVLTMIFQLFICDLMGQQLEGLYMDKLENGSTIFVITNRESNGIIYSNEVRCPQGLDYLKATFYHPDSLDITPMDSLMLLNAIADHQGDWCLFIHGDSKTFEQAVMRGYDIQHLHDINTIVFSWPSKDLAINGVKNFKNSQDHVIESLGHFNQVMHLMHALRQRNKDLKLSMLIHSLGNAYLENIVKQGLDSYRLPVIFDNMIVNAAAVNQEGHREWLEKIGFQTSTYVTCNTQDFNLKGLRIFTKEGKQLGEKIEPPLAANAQYIHFSDAVGFQFRTGMTHTYFIGEIPDRSKNIRIFYRELLHGRAIDFNTRTMFRKRKDGLGYDIIF